MMILTSSEKDKGNRPITTTVECVGTEKQCKTKMMELGGHCINDDGVHVSQHHIKTPNESWEIHDIGMFVDLFKLAPVQARQHIISQLVELDEERDWRC